MSKTKQTAVEWLVEQIQNDRIEIIYSDKIYSIKCIPAIVQQAKAMEKEQIICARMNGMTDDELSYINADQYYNETYNND